MNVYAVDIEQQPITLPAGPFLESSATWVQVRPNLRRLHVLAGDIMAAYGKRHDLSSKGRNEHEDIAHAVAWLQAYGSPALVVVDAQWLHHLILRGLVELASDAGVELWLLHRGERTDIFDRALVRHQAQPVPVSAIPATRCPDVAERTTATFPAVAADDFHTFLASCRRRLAPADLVLVERRLRAAVQRCQEGFPAPAPAAAVAGLLDDLLHDAPGDAELTVDVRALQIAGWHHDLYIKVDLPRLLNSEERPTVTPAAAADALTAYRQPYRSLLVALTHRRHGLDDIAGITIGGTADDGTRLTIAGTDEHFDGQLAIAVRATRLLRLGDGASDADPLLPHSDRALARALNEAATDLGIHVYGRRAERTRPKFESWLGRFGITVHELP